MSESNLRDFFEARIEENLALLKTGVAFELPSSDKYLVDKLGAYFQDVLKNLGADVAIHEREKTGNILLAQWNSQSSRKPILILSHMDTVWPAGTLAQNMPIKIENGRFYGPGALDMKAGIVIALEAIRGLQDRGEFPERPVWMMITADEEISSHDSRELIQATAQQCGLCLVMEPAADSIHESLKTARKGLATYNLRVKGRASHAGNAPEAGINAIVELAHQIVRIDGLNNLRAGTSVSVTTSQGGIAGNVIPADASCYVDVRFFRKDEAKRVDAAIKGLLSMVPGSELDIQGGIDRMPMEKTEQITAAFWQARRIADSLNLPLGEAAAGGVSDANEVAQAGIPVLDGLGAVGEGMHALHEHVVIDSLARRTALLAGILRDWQFEDEKKG